MNYSVRDKEFADWEIAEQSSASDWSREKPSRFWDPGRKLLRSIRDYQFNRERTGPWPRIKCKFAVLRHRFWTVVTGAEIPLNCSIGGGLLIPHPNGIVIHPDAKIGANCLIFQQVTLGTRGDHGGVPVLEENVDIGAGAKLLGPIHVGAFARIGANALVIDDVPPRSVAIGVPARSSRIASWPD
ncbi:MAG: serine acetyltransferase [Hyphomicrobium sp.]|uniref:serine O-acetyltransferase n=1 Tax=Hyphomicrobium sp. TaxID=82 RepID=UPI0039E6914E